MPAVSQRLTAQTHDSAESCELPRGAVKLFKLLQWYAGKFSDVCPSQKKLAEQIERSERSIRSYLRVLERAGLVTVTKCGPDTARYRVIQAVERPEEERQNCRSFAGQLPGSSLLPEFSGSNASAPRIPPSKETRRKPSREDPETVEQVAYWVNDYAARMRSHVECDPAAAIRLSRALRTSGKDLDALEAVFFEMIAGGQKPPSLGWVIYVIESKLGVRNAA